MASMIPAMLLAIVNICHEPLTCLVKDRFVLVEATIEPASAKLPAMERAGSVLYLIEVVAADGTYRETPEISAQVVKRREDCPEGAFVAGEAEKGDVRILSNRRGARASRPVPEPGAS
jgi:hypothetical protein